MTDLTELELQNIRHLITGYETSHDKMTEYAEKAVDKNLQQFFNKAAQSAVDNKNELMRFLGQKGEHYAGKIYGNRFVRIH